MRKPEEAVGLRAAAGEGEEVMGFRDETELEAMRQG